MEQGVGGLRETGAVGGSGIVAVGGCGLGGCIRVGGLCGVVAAEGCEQWGLEGGLEGPPRAVWGLDEEGGVGQGLCGCKGLEGGWWGEAEGGGSATFLCARPCSSP